MKPKQNAPFGLRMPDSVKREVKALAEAERRSMNSQIVAMLENEIAEKSNEKGA